MGTNYRPCYVQVVRDLVHGEDIHEYPEFAERGHTSVEELAWKLYAEMAVEVNRLIDIFSNDYTVTIIQIQNNR